jgi:tRNA nucleotidyltransferase (CCA-adding enzyme)
MSSVKRSSVKGSSVKPAPGDGAAVLARVGELPGGRELLELAQTRGGEIVLIGGAVRDLLLDAGAPRELDVVVAQDSLGLAGMLAARLSHERHFGPDALTPRVHDRFGTASVEWPAGRVDIAERRGERYMRPGALPEVHPGTVEEDLARRDFTVNTLAVPLAGPRRGELHGADGALDDLAARRLRVLHEQSFRDDPTRLLRMARYRARLGFELEEQTARLAREAVTAGALDTVSPARIGAELRLALAEPDPVAALESMQQLGLLSALHEAIALDAPLARASLAALPESPDAWPDVLLLASLLRPGHSFDTTDYETRLRALLDGWELPAAERERAVRSAVLAPRIAERLQRAQRPSEIYEVVHREPLEAVALAAAIADEEGQAEAAAAARSWLRELRNVRLQITGDDLLQAGISPGPELGRRLARALMRKLDGELAGTREAELGAALES